MITTELKKMPGIHIWSKLRNEDALLFYWRANVCVRVCDKNIDSYWNQVVENG